MQQADASPPEPAAAEAVQEQIAPTPPQEKPEVVAPPEQKAEPTPPKPEPAKVGPGDKADAGEAESGSRGRQEADRGAACAAHDGLPEAERQAPAASAASAGASAAALASYRQLVRAHLQRFKQYPPAAKAAGQQGVGRVSFTLSRNGQVLAEQPRRLVGPSGAGCRDAGDGAPSPAVPALSVGYEAGLDAASPCR